MRNFPTHFWTRFTVEYKDRVAFIRPDGANAVTSETYWEWTRRVQRLAVGLLDAGFETGARIGFIAKNSQEWIDLAFAAWMVGGCVVPLPSDRDRKESLRCLARCGAEWIVVTDDAALVAIRGSGNLPEHLKFIALKKLVANKLDGVFDTDVLLERGKYRQQRGAMSDLGKRTYELDPTLPSIVLFPFDPGDDPHGAFFQGGKLAVMLEYLGADLMLEESDQLAVLINNGWFYGFLVTIAALLQGRTIVGAESVADLDAALGLLKPTVLVTGPAYIEGQTRRWKERLEKAPGFMTDNAEDKAFGFGRMLSIVGEKAARKVLYEPIRQDLGGRAKRIYLVGDALGLQPSDDVYDILHQAGVEVLGMFGLPETGISHIERPGAVRRHSVGRPVQGYVCKIDGARGEETGMVLIRSDVLSEGYWDDTGPRPRDEDGYVQTHVIGHLASGYLFLDSNP
ncbi:MAG: AMP-binding protein [bacterium]